MLFVRAFIATLCLSLLSSLAQAQRPHVVERVMALTIQSSINPSTYSYLKNSLTYAKEHSFDAIVIRINTPGGLVMTTKSILALMGDSDLPFIFWVAPEGASATSAGAILGSGAHFLVMAPGTNIGAATPIEITGDLGKDVRKKAINDLVALVKGLSQQHGRNANLFAEMISEARSFSANEAQEKGVIDGIAANYSELWRLLDKKSFHIKGSSRHLELKASVQVQPHDMSVGEKFLDILANPSLAYILFLLGAALLYFELQAPGGFIAGAMGLSLLILAGIGFEVLPLNFGALALMVLGLIFFILEAFITSYGMLATGGLIALTLGSLFLYTGDQGSVHLGSGMIFSSLAAVCTFFLFIAFFLAKTKRNKKSFFSLVGQHGQITEVLGEGLYRLKIQGEIWKARSEDKLSVGQTVVVIKKDPQRLELEVKEA